MRVAAGRFANFKNQAEMLNNKPFFVIFLKKIRFF